MSGPAPPATGPALMEQFIQLRAEFDVFAAEARAHWTKEEERMRLVDQFIDPSIDLDSLLKQVLAACQMQQDALHELERSVREQQRIVYTAMRIRLGTQGLDRKRKAS